MEGGKDQTVVRSSFASPLARRYILVTFTFATVLTLVVTTCEIYFVYCDQLDNVVEIHEEIANLAVPVIRQALWEFNSEIIGATLNSVVSNSVVDYIHLKTDSHSIGVGLSEGFGILSSFDLVKVFQGSEQRLGELTLETRQISVVLSVVELALIKLAVNGAKTTTVIIFSMFVFHHLVNKHLVSFAQNFRRYGVTNSDRPPLMVERHYLENGYSDEIDELAVALNSASVELDLRLKQRERALLEFKTLEETHRQQLYRIDSLMRSVRQSVSFFSSDGTLAFSSVINLSEAHKAKELLLKKYINENQITELGQSLDIETRLVSTISTRDCSDILQFEVSDESSRWTLCIVIEDDGAQAMLLSDITEISKQKQVYMASKKVAAIGTIAASVAHELNNGLAVLKGRTELLGHLVTAPSSDVAKDMDLVDQQEAIESIETIKTQIDQLTATSRLILGFARSSDEGAIELQSVGRLEGAAQQAVGEFVSGGKISRVSSEIDGSVLVDLTQFLFSLRNLIKNANEATVPGESIDVSFRASTGSEIDEADLAKTEKYVSIDIRDQGAGISKSVQQQLFSPFVSTKGGSTGLSLGTGLGLWYVQNFVACYDGAILYRPNTPKGSWFTLLLPLSQSAVDIARPPPPFLQSSTSTEVVQKEFVETHFLLVEDNLDMVSILESFLGRYGCAVTSCHTVSDALSVLDDGSSFDGLISDLNLPDGLGSSVLKYYDSINGRGPRVLMTGSLKLDTEDSSLLDEIIVLTKPFALGALAKILFDAKREMTSESVGELEAIH